MTPYYEDDAVTIYHGDARDWDGVVVDAILTDPPYDRQALPLWELLADLSTNLAAGGWLVAYSGQAFLPDVYAALSTEALGYCWTLSARYEGGGQVINRDDLTVLTEWKPLLAYRRRPFGTARGEGGRFVAGPGRRETLRDLLPRGGREKSHHPWAQPAAEALRLVEMFSSPGETILDPFMGSGTTLATAKRLGRKAIGIELEERYCEIAAERCGGPIRTDHGAFDFGAAS